MSPKLVSLWQRALRAERDDKAVEINGIYYEPDAVIATMHYIYHVMGFPEPLSKEIK